MANEQRKGENLRSKLGGGGAGVKAGCYVIVGFEEKKIDGVDRTYLSVNFIESDKPQTPQDVVKTRSAGWFLHKGYDENGDILYLVDGNSTNDSFVDTMDNKVFDAGGYVKYEEEDEDVFYIVGREIERTKDEAGNEIIEKDEMVISGKKFRVKKGKRMKVTFHPFE